MKKLLLSTAAVCGLMAATPASAQDLSLELGGYFAGYLASVSQDEATGLEVNNIDMLRDTEIYFTGETTLDNGLTVGVHFETEADGGDAMTVNESYMYLSGAWGRLNAGEENGAAYLLQVAAPSADSNVDGISQDIQPVNYAQAKSNTELTAAVFDYAQDPSGKDDNLTYLTPVFSGFQAGFSYVFDNGDANDTAGVRRDDEKDQTREAYEAALRYEGSMDEIDFALGAGYSHVSFDPLTTPVVTKGVTSDDRTVYNVGLDIDWGAFGFGASYKNDDLGDRYQVDEAKTYVIGVDYTTGPFKLGASYMRDKRGLSNDATDLDGNFGAGSNVEEMETDRYTAGVIYTYGPGMTFRGSVQYIDHDFSNDATAGSDSDATSVLIGTQVQF